MCERKGGVPGTKDNLQPPDESCPTLGVMVVPRGRTAGHTKNQDVHNISPFQPFSCRETEGGVQGAFACSPPRSSSRNQKSRKMLRVLERPGVCTPPTCPGSR